MAASGVEERAGGSPPEAKSPGKRRILLIPEFVQHEHVLDP
jgi:hypothetical protein